MSLLVRSEILGLFVNTLIADVKRSRHYGGNFAQPIQMTLSIKSKAFSPNFVAFLKSI